MIQKSAPLQTRPEPEKQTEKKNREVKLKSERKNLNNGTIQKSALLQTRPESEKQN